MCALLVWHLITKSVHMYKMFIDWHLVLRNSELKCSPLVVSIVNYAYLNYIAWIEKLKWFRSD